MPPSWAHAGMGFLLMWLLLSHQVPVSDPSAMLLQTPINSLGTKVDLDGIIPLFCLCLLYPR